MSDTTHPNDADPDPVVVETEAIADLDAENDDVVGGVACRAAPPSVPW